jgi:molybdopterin-guanine dinucleotide biosynthesis protein A
MPSERSGPVAGILLAAGTSSRMGSNKLFFELNGESVLRGAVRRALADFDVPDDYDRLKAKTGKASRPSR